MPAAAPPRRKAGPQGGAGLRIINQTVEMVPVGAIRPHPENPRRGDVEAILESVRHHGFYGVIVAQRSSGFILVGNHRYLVATQEGAAELPVCWLDVDDDEARRILLVDNRTADEAAYDTEALAELLQSLLEDSGNIAGTGYSIDDLDKILAELEQERSPRDNSENAARAAEELAALQKKWGTEPGQVWTFASRSVPGAAHRLACGDSTDSKHIHRLMDGERADCVYTDPPYGVDYESETHGKIEGDRRAKAALQELLEAAFRNAARHTTASAAFYVWHASATREVFAAAMRAAGLDERQYIIWAKDSFVLGRAHYHWQHEPCFYAGKVGQRVAFNDDRTQSTVWRIRRAGSEGEPLVVSVPADGAIITTASGATIYLANEAPKGRKRKAEAIQLPDGVELVLTQDTGRTDLWTVSRDPATEYMHPTQKPVELAVRAIRNSTQPGGRVLDLFHGGGATLVGCEHTGRIGYANELDPRFVAYNIQRLADLGLTPRLEGRA